MPLEVLCMFPQDGAVETSKDKVIIQVVPGVRDRQFPEEMMVRLHDVVHTGPHIPPQIDHTPRPTVPVPGELARKKVRRYILKAHSR